MSKDTNAAGAYVVNEVTKGDDLVDISVTDHDVDLQAKPGGVRLWVNSSAEEIEVVTVVYQMKRDSAPVARKVVAPGYAPGRAIKVMKVGTTATGVIEEHD